ncbi:MAG: hypothetical protein C5B55_00795 [Blastocatellia bacterium]|nr:MAG: hypothetical protein C5B55_00795 [Blastocatellia bacterium]
MQQELTLSGLFAQLLALPSKKPAQSATAAKYGSQYIPRIAKVKRFSTENRINLHFFVTAKTATPFKDIFFIECYIFS